MVKPKKHLGQHFLTDHNIARKIVEQLTDHNTLVLEIGPGTGVLTRFLLPRFNDRLHLVEIDAESEAHLQTQYPALQDRIHLADFLKVDIATLAPGKWSIIGNFPYNISSQIFFSIIQQRDQIVEVVGMVQKEVAERIATGPGSKTYGILSVLLQAWFDIEYCFTVGPGVFHPPPKVNSAVIRLKRNAINHLGCDAAVFHQVVKTGFNQRRKTLRNALKPLLSPTAGDHELLAKRAEQLSVKDFVELAQLVESGR